MPELPDVASFEAYLNRAAIPHTVARLSVSDERILDDGLTAQGLGRRLKKARLSETRRHGKYLLVHAGNSGWLALHFGMTGYPRFYDAGDDPPGHTRLRLDFTDGSHLAIVWQRMLGDVAFAETPGELAEAKDLGPDALDDGVDADRFAAMYTGRKGMVKPALMDQSTVAGIGNVYADEILFQAGVHPKRACNDLGEKAWRTMHRVMRRVLRTASRRRSEGKRLPSGYLLRARETDGQCPNGHGDLEKTKVSGRATWLCSRCQA